MLDVGRILIDGSDPTIVRVAKDFSSMPFPIEPCAPADGPPLFATRIYYNPESRSSIFIVPAISGVILQLTWCCSPR